ncbi:hypothetical protein [Mycobacteroides abscessus]
MEDQESLTDDRVQVGYNTALCLNEIGLEIAQSDNEAERGVGLVVQIAAELIAGSTLCAFQEVYYSSAALHRQIIEVMHLLSYFAKDATASARWVNIPLMSKPSPEFQPGNLRKATVIGSIEYRNHCELAGHPRIGGSIFLSGSKHHEEPFQVRSRITGALIAAQMKDLVLTDGLRHTHDVFHAAVDAIKAVGLMGELFYFHLLNQQIEIDTWASQDPLASITIASD